MSLLELKKKNFCLFLQFVCFLVIMSGSLFCLAEGSEKVDAPIKLYANEVVESARQMESINRTLETIENAIAPRKLEVHSVSLDEIDVAFNNNEVDILISGPAIYWKYLNAGLRDIATLVTRRQPNPDHAVGSLILAKEGEDHINSLADLKGKTFGASHPFGLQGYIAVLKDIEDNGFDSSRFFKKTTFYGPDTGKRLEALRKGEVDAIAINVCYVEDSLDKGKNVLAGLKTVAERIPNESNCRASTTLYPNWTFLISPNMDGQTSVKIATALYSMDSEPDGQKWTIGSDYRSVDNLYRILKIGQYSYLNSWTIERIWDEYKLLICIAVLGVVFFIWHHFRVSNLVEQRTAELKLALAKEKKLFKSLQDVTRKLEKTRKAVVVSQLSNLVVHELSQPLASIGFYARAQKVLLDRKPKSPDVRKLAEAASGIFNLTDRASQIIQKVRTYATSKNEVFQPIDLKALIEKTVNSMIGTGRLKAEEIRLSFSSEPVYISGSSLELELLFTNIIKNSLEAPNDLAPLIDIKLNLLPKDKVEVIISDNGSPMTSEEFNKILEPLDSAKPQGLGLGMSIVQAIVERHLGTLTASQQDRGVVFKLVFPLRS